MPINLSLRPHKGYSRNEPTNINLAKSGEILSWNPINPNTTRRDYIGPKLESKLIGYISRNPCQVHELLPKTFTRNPSVGLSPIILDLTGVSVFYSTIEKVAQQ